MALMLIEVDGTGATAACTAELGCGAVVELAAEAFAPVPDGGLVYSCPACGAVATAPRVTPEEAMATLIDPGVVAARRLWRRARWARDRKLAPDTYEPYIDWPVPPGEHTRNLALLWQTLDAAGWPDLDAAARARRHEAALARWEAER